MVLTNVLFGPKCCQDLLFCIDYLLTRVEIKMLCWIAKLKHSIWHACMWDILNSCHNSSSLLSPPGKFVGLEINQVITKRVTKYNLLLTCSILNPQTREALQQQQQSVHCYATVIINSTEFGSLGISHPYLHNKLTGYCDNNMIFLSMTDISSLSNFHTYFSARIGTSFIVMAFTGTTA